MWASRQACNADDASDDASGPEVWQHLAGKSDCSAEFVNAFALLLAGPIHAAQVQNSLDAVPPHVISAAGSICNQQP